MKPFHKFWAWMGRWSSPQKIVLSFAAIILIGAVLLSLPVSSAGGEPMAFSNALFTSASAVCVTGITVFELAETLSFTGQAILLALVQIGGLGFMTVMVMVFVGVRKRVSTRDRRVLGEVLSSGDMHSVVGLARQVVGFTVAIELLGAALLAVRFVPQFGWGQGLWSAVFHAVSAFCNAGFDLLGAQSLMGYIDDPLINFTIMGLVFMGGIGFIVLSNLWAWLCTRRHERPVRLSLHTRAALWVSLGLILMGALAIGASEWSNPDTLGGQPWGVRVMASLFASVSARTAGFYTLRPEMLLPTASFFVIVLMFIGASPASTGGGVKTTTALALGLFVRKVMRNDEQTRLGKRSLGAEVIARALSIFVIMIGLWLVLVLMLTLFSPPHKISLETAMFEAMSLMSTTGLMRGNLIFPATSRILMVVAMFLGRIGPLTVLIAVASRRERKPAAKVPEDKLMVG